MPKPVSIPALSANTNTDMQSLRDATKDRAAVAKQKAAEGNPHKATYKPFPEVPTVDNIVQDHYGRIAEAAENVRKKQK